MSASGLISRNTSRFFPELIPPEIGKGELVTGGRNIGQERRAYLESIRLSTDLDKIVVPAGEDGSVLQADSSTATGLKWVPHEPLAVSLNKKVDSIVEFLKSLIRQRVEEEANRLESLPKLFVRNSIDGMTYIIPLNSTNDVQSVIDHLDKTFLFSLINDCSQVNVVFDKRKLEPGRTLADYNIQNESTVHLLCIANAGGSKRKKSKRK
jgi:hypothetical protein